MAQGEPINIIGKGMTVRGNVTGGGDLIIEGRVEGTMALESRLTIEGSGAVQADVRAEEITINGQASGTLDAGSKISIRAAAKVDGEIKAPVVVIEDGAVFHGSILMDVTLPDDI